MQLYFRERIKLDKFFTVYIEVRFSSYCDEEACFYAHTIYKFNFYILEIEKYETFSKNYNHNINCWSII